MNRPARGVLWLATSIVGLRNHRSYLIALLPFAFVTGAGLRLVASAVRRKAVMWAVLQGAAGVVILLAEAAFIVLAIVLLVRARREDADRVQGRHARPN